MAGGRNAEVAARLDESACFAREADERTVLGWALTQRRYVKLFEGEPDLARIHLQEAVSVCRQLGDFYAAGLANVGLAHAAIACGLPAQADTLLGEVETQVRTLRAPWILAVTLNTRGRLALVSGDLASAEAALRESASILGRLRDTWAMRFALMHLADAAALAADARRAALLYGAADLLVERNRSSFPVYERLTERCRAAVTTQIGLAAFEAIHREGMTLRPDEVLALATG